MKLYYEPLEKIKIERPVNRVSYILERSRSKVVLDLGCYDESALVKKGTGYWLHEEISKVATFVLGMDNSAGMPDKGLSINERSRMVKGDIREMHGKDLEGYDFDLILAGELIEHLPNTSEFFKKMKNEFRGKRLICSTPNAVALCNVLLGVFKRESTHEHHLQIYSYKTLNTLCQKIGFAEWKIIPYHVRFTEMTLKTTGIKRFFLRLTEKVITGFETLFPLLSGGFIIDIKI